jgi:hypothetical protein
VSFALLSKQNETAAPGRTSTLRVGPADDAFEQEADRVAATVLGGGRIPAWSISKMGIGPIRRQPTPQTVPPPNNYAEAGSKLAEAFLQTDIGKQLTQTLSEDPLAKAAEGFVSTLPGKVVAGAAATGAVAAMAATHTPLPAQIPEIPLDGLTPGLKVKITYEGPVDHPTKAMVTFSYAPGGSQKKPAQSSADRIRLENARMAAEQEKFRAGLHYQPGSPQDLAQKAEQEAERKMIERWTLDRMRPFPESGASGPLRPSAAAAGPSQTAGHLDLPKFESPFKPKAPALLDRKLELKPLNPSNDDSKREEFPVQRKAFSLDPDTADLRLVDPVLKSPGRPLDKATRQLMESRIGCDFGKVRVHTDSEAAASAQALGALAFTRGHHIVFGARMYSPNTAEGKRLIAHELAHVVQQYAAPPRPHAPALAIRQAPQGIIQREDDENAEPAAKTSWFSNPLDKLKAVAKKIPGYRLFTVIIGKDPISGDSVPRDATNLTRGVLNLVPGGDRAFENLKESGAIDRAFNWLSGQVAQLGFTIDYFKGLIENALKSLGLSDIADPQGAVARIAGFFQPPLEKVKTFAVAVFDKILEFLFEAVLEALGGLGILEILRKAGQAFKSILKDPVGFLKNLLRALAQGFTQFKDKILDYLKEGLVKWLFGEIAATGLVLPKKFDVAGIVGMVLQVLGLTWTKFRKRLVGLLGEDAVAVLEGAFDILVTMKNEGLGAAWKLILKMADKLIDTMLGAVRNWVVTNIVVAAVTRLATMFNPVGAVVQAIRVIYNTVTFFVEKAKQIAALAQAVFDSISEIAAGNVTKAANYVEASMARTIPVMLGFLAGQIGLGGIGKRVRDIIQGIQAKVDNAIDKVLEYIVSKGKDLYAKGKETVAKVVEWWKQSKGLKIGGEDHTLYMEGTEDAPLVMIASVPGRKWTKYLADKAKTVDKADAAKQTLLTDARKLARDLEARLEPSKDPGAKAQAVEKRRGWFDLLAEKLVALGFTSEEKAPASKIEYAKDLTTDGGGTKTTASILSKNHPKGSEPSDDPPIWTKLDELPRKRKKQYVQGHLLNHNLGGEGRRFNLTPITKTANSQHLANVERFVKEWVHNKKKNYVFSYWVKAIYETGRHKKPSRYLELSDMEQKGQLEVTDKLSKSEKRGRKNLQGQLLAYQTEQTLCTRLEYEARQLDYVGGQWVDTNGKEIDGEAPKNIPKDHVDNEIKE